MWRALARLLADLLAPAVIVLYDERMTKGQTPPLTIAVGYLKGGTAKSTTAVMLALGIAAETGETVALLDTDQANATATGWRRVAGESWPESVTVERWTEGGEEGAAEACKRLLETHRHLVVDTGPGGEKVLSDALTVAHHLVCPMPAAPPEVMSLRPTLNVAAKAAREHGAELHVLLTKVDRRTREARDVREQLAAMELPVMTADVSLRKRYREVVGTAPTAARDMAEYAAVLHELTGERTSA